MRESAHFDFVPYGHINLDFLEGAGVPPPAFLPVESRQNERMKQWKEFVDKIADDLASWLWPTWNDSGWEGNAAKHMLAMTVQDLGLLRTARTVLDREALVRRDLGGGRRERFSVGATHATMFLEEDGGQLATTYELYDPGLVQTRAKLSDDFERAIVTLGGDLDIDLKLRLQRPRPYQVSYLLDRRAGDFSFRHATRADTPSMISGHCFAGCIGGVGVYELLLSLGIGLSPSGMLALQQYTVDIGDRRVFAGVHFPTDNVASWYTSLRLLPALASPFAVEMQAFLKEAIVNCSEVYKMLAAEKTDPVRGVVRRLNELLDVEAT